MQRARSSPTTCPPTATSCSWPSASPTACGLLERKFPDIALVDLGPARRQRLRAAAPRALRRRHRRAASIRRPRCMVLSGRASELDRVRGFDRGADDYVCKPFSYPELRGRVEALLRRSQRKPARGCVRAGELRGRSGVARGAAARRRAWCCRRRSSRCCGRSSPIRRGCSRRRSSCARSGATAPRARPARWTHTPAGCARSSASTVTASS